MRIISLLVILVSISCKPTQSTAQMVNESAHKNLPQLLVVLNNTTSVKEAEAYVTNSGLLWETAKTSLKNKKIGFITITNHDAKFWLERMQYARLFDSIERAENTSVATLEQFYKQQLLNIKTTACKGHCPVYNVSISKNGLVVFKGESFTKVQGKQSFTLTKERFRQLQEQLNTMHFSSFDTSYSNPRIMDLPSTYITYKDKTIHIKLWNNTPEPLKTLKNTIESILKNEKLL